MSGLCVGGMAGPSCERINWWNVSRLKICHENSMRLATFRLWETGWSLGNNSLSTRPRFNVVEAEKCRLGSNSPDMVAAMLKQTKIVSARFEEACCHLTLVIGRHLVM